MKYERFEDLPVWQDGIELTVSVFTLTEDESFRDKGDLANRLQRASLSVPNNISEGFERGATQELRAFLYYARGSVDEVRFVCHMIRCLECFEHMKAGISDLESEAESISRQLGAWADSLENTDFRGQRYLADATGEMAEREKRTAEFRKKIREINDRAAGKRRQDQADS
ncbi:MAG: four helix bundle protein [Verrucomicrobia bacterium]|nr:four helix bundle protein [Verrucomicrobiota bacterium]